MQNIKHFTKKEVKNFITSLLLIRIVEEKIAEFYGKPGDPQQMRCPVHLSIGQEAAAVGVCSQIKKTDKVFSNHRCHAHYLAKGGNLRKMILELHGKLGGCLDGRGGSMHLMDPDVGMVTSIPIVSSAIPLAVGSALADSLNEESKVSLVFFGDASVEEGVFHESANFAALNNLPVIFVCENNEYSVYTHLSDRQPDRDLDLLGKAHGLSVMRADGNDVFDVAENFQIALHSVKSGNGPLLFIMDTYRFREHCGVNDDDHLNYRNSQIVEQWQVRDPIKIAQDKALFHGLINNEFIAEETRVITKLVEAEFQFAIDAPLPSPDLAANFVYSQ